MALFDAFLKLDGIKGESQDSKHKGEIDILSFSWGATNTGSAVTGGGSGSGKVHFHDISLTKLSDASSPLLMAACAKGDHIKSGLLTVRKAGGTQLEYIKIKLDEVLISSFQHGGGSSDNTLTTDSLTLNFAKLEYDYQPQKADGTADGGPIIKWHDQKNNTNG